MTTRGEETRQTFEATITRQVQANYLVVKPKDFDPKQRHPLLLFLHGRGEQGNDTDLLKKHGPFRVAEELELPFLIIAPQSPLDEWWDIDMLSALVDHVLEEHPVDPQRVYLTGLSMGGFGAWELAIRRPDVFAAIVPICGRGQPSKAARIRHLPVWAFHGAQDQTVLLRETTRMIDALYAVGNDARLTVYPSAGHDSWTETYSNPQLYQWLLSHQRPDAADR